MADSDQWRRPCPTPLAADCRGVHTRVNCGSGDVAVSDEQAELESAERGQARNNRYRNARRRSPAWDNDDCPYADGKGACRSGCPAGAQRQEAAFTRDQSVGKVPQTKVGMAAHGGRRVRLFSLHGCSSTSPRMPKAAEIGAEGAFFCNADARLAPAVPRKYIPHGMTGFHCGGFRDETEASSIWARHHPRVPCSCPTDVSGEIAGKPFTLEE